MNTEKRRLIPRALGVVSLEKARKLSRSRRQIGTKKLISDSMSTREVSTRVESDLNIEYSIRLRWRRLK
jgi:hypothetical protein